MPRNRINQDQPQLTGLEEARPESAPPVRPAEVQKSIKHGSIKQAESSDEEEQVTRNKDQKPDDSHAGTQEGSFSPSPLRERRRGGEVAPGLLEGTQIVYVSPLKALGNDIQRNLEAPLTELAEVANDMGVPFPDIRTAVRTGDTPQKDRQAFVKHPPHILITTPESLYLMLTAARSRETLRSVRTVIVDEIHALARDKRGSHLALSLARLDALVQAAHPEGVAPPVRLGLSATQRPIEAIARFLVGATHVV